jgi:chromosome segregation ATPase
MDEEIYTRSDRNRSQSFISKTNPYISSDTNYLVQTQETLTNREDIKIKELVAKIQVLSNAIIEERNKSSNFEKELNRIRKQKTECEETINQKENMIINLSKEKYDLQSKLDMEKKKFVENHTGNNFSNLLSGIFTNKKEAINITIENEMKSLFNENEDLKMENEILRNKIEEHSLDFENCKIEYQKLINLQLEKLRKVEAVVSEKNKNVEDLNKKFEMMCESYKRLDIEKTKYESESKNTKEELKIREEKIVELLLKLEDKEKVVNGYQESIMRHEKESAELARKLAELKNAILEGNMVIQSFKCEKVGTIFNSTIQITFGRTDDDEYVMIIKEDDKDEYVNVEDIEYLKSNGKSIDIVEICYLVINSF